MIFNIEGGRIIFKFDCLELVFVGDFKNMLVSL